MWGLLCCSFLKALCIDIRCVRMMGSGDTMHFIKASSHPSLRGDSFNQK